MFHLDKIIEACHLLAPTPYGPDLYRPAIVYELGMLPINDMGSLGTTGGLAIHFRDYEPIWIETPWGEWHCWSHPHVGGVVKAMRIFKDYKATLQVDEERSTEHRWGLDVLALKAVGDIELPPYEQCRVQRWKEEWVALCLEHDPPFPVPEFYERRYHESHR